MKYIDAEKLKDEIKHLKIDVYDEAHQFDLGARSSLTFLESVIDSLQQENEIVEFTFKGGTYRVNGEEHAFKGGKAKVIILEINQEEGNE